MKKRLLSLLLVALLSLGTLSVATAEAQAPVDLTVMASLHELTRDPQTIPYLDQLAKDTNVNVTWIPVRSGWNEKLAATLASGDLPDVFLSGLDSVTCTQNPELFVNLCDYLDVMPNVSAMFEKHPDLKAACTELDGSIYLLDGYNPFRPVTMITMMINKQWLENLNLPMPETLDELKQTLIAFRDNDPNGNGLKDEIPFDFYAAEWQGYYNPFNLLGSWGVTDNNNHVYVSDDGVCTLFYQLDAYKELAMYMHDLWSEDLCNKESFTQDYTMYQANAQNPDAPCVGFTFGWQISNRVGDKWADQYVTIAPFSLEKGEPAYFDYWGWQGSAAMRSCCITTSCKDIEAAARYLDAFYSDDYSAQTAFGSIGEGIVKNEDGTYECQTPPEGEDVTRWLWTISPYMQAPFCVDSDLQARINALSSFTERLGEDAPYLDHFRAENTIYPAFFTKFSSEDADELSLLMTDINNYASTTWAHWVIEGGVETEWDAFQKQLTDMGIAKVNEIYQRGYDNYYGISK